MKKATSVKELNAVILGSKSSHKYLVGNIILGTDAFDAVDSTFDCERREGEVCERSVTLVKSPGWLRGYHLCDTPELVRTETILSVTLCPPGVHGFILVINAEQPFKKVHKKVTKDYLQHYFGEKVWHHTIVVFSHRGHLGYKTIEDYIRGEGAPLRSLLESCGNRYHVLGDNGTDSHAVKVSELFEKIDAMVAENSCYEILSALTQSAKERRKEVDQKAEELRQQSQQQRQLLGNLLLEPKPSLRVLMVGWVFSGKSATGNRILRAEVFQSGDRTMKVLRQSGEVNGREVVIVDTPGWWKFFPAVFTPAALKSEIWSAVSLCSPSPNVILLAVPLDTAFTEDQRRVTEDNMRLLGKRAWRHVIVLFTFGDVLVRKTIEQHIESEGKPLRWLIEKCEKRYHVLDNRSTDDGQVTELLERMEEMVAGNSCFYLSETNDPQPEREGGDGLAENKDENRVKEITEQLNIEWNRRNWEKYHIFKGDVSMDIRPTFNEDRKKSEASAGEKEEEKEEDEEAHEGDQFKTSLEGESDDDAGSGSLKIMKGLLEREWSRREASMEHFHELIADKGVSSEPDLDQLRKSRDKVLLWLETQHTTSGCRSEKENQRGKRRPALQPKNPAGSAATRRKTYSYNY